VTPKVLSASRLRRVFHDTIAVEASLDPATARHSAESVA